MFENSWKEELGHVKRFIEYVVKRGGSVVIPNVAVKKKIFLPLLL